jgi:hypothetical protein
MVSYRRRPRRGTALRVEEAEQAGDRAALPRVAGLRIGAR